MREIKFRGKRVDNGEWVYGSLHYEEVECEKQYFKDGANNHMLGIDVRPVIEVDDDSSSERLSDYVVIPKSVGQFASLPDKNGKEIYEGDVAKTFTGNIAEIKYGEYQDNDVIDSDESSYMDADGEERKTVGFYAERVNGECYGLDNMTYKWIEVIGNIYENPSLLEVQP